MAFTLGLARTGYPEQGDVIRQVERAATRAAAKGVELLVFPENLMHPTELAANELRSLAEPPNGPFAQAICDVARTHGMWVVFTMLQTNPTGGLPYNTAVIADAYGTIQATYRKTHLYDAHAVRESDRMSAGDKPATAVITPFCTLGVGICYDLRFPEVSRGLALAGSDVLVFPAAWHDGPHKELHWETLLRARAIENECFVAGVCHGAPHCVGTSHVFGPLGQTIASGSNELTVCSVDPQEAQAARDAMPVFEHRRPELYR